MTADNKVHSENKIRSIGWLFYIKVVKPLQYASWQQLSVKIFHTNMTITNLIFDRIHNSVITFPIQMNTTHSAQPSERYWCAKKTRIHVWHVQCTMTHVWGLFLFRGHSTQEPSSIIRQRAGWPILFRRPRQVPALGTANTTQPRERVLGNKVKVNGPRR